ncbi:hypothetical protein GQ53DRAFT_823729 [Thozetella sp. PMI_491]|nr:hypothetical protein GQ53DRAFT_823729 [Thozetella sp. PMI_491]
MSTRMSITPRYQEVSQALSYYDMPERTSISNTSDSDATAKEEDYDETIEGLLSHRHAQRPRHQHDICTAKTLTYVVAVLVILVLFEAGALIFIKSRAVANTSIYSSLGLSRERSTERHGEWPNRFFSGDIALNEQSWEELNTGHGVVSLTPQEADQFQVAIGHAHPLDPEKVMYSIEGYHLLHCAKILRKHYLQVRRGEETGIPVEHDLHCFDVIRKSIVCEASDQLLVWHGEALTLGVNQTRQCRDWSALRDWATAHTACYKDFYPGPGETRYGHCDDGTDGVLY